MTKKIYAFFTALVFALSMPLGLQAYEVPQDNSNIEYMYVFGPDGNPLRGAEKPQKEIYFDVPQSETRQLTIQVYDPDTYRSPDSKGGFGWNTKTQFELYGTKFLDEVTTGAGEKTHHKEYVTFGPYTKDQGQKVGEYYRFKLVVTASEGDDQNLYKLEVSPETTEAFAYDITFRLASGKGKMKYFYPAVAENTTGLTVYNYDIDPAGGTSSLVDNQSAKEYGINDSDSGQYAETKIKLEKGPARKLVYMIRRGFQFGANGGLRIVDDQGNPVPIYFNGPEPRKAEPIKPAPAPVQKTTAPVNACNRFVFDARQSYDPNKDKITYAWDFGDGTTSTEPVVTHVYETGGRYNVTLTVSDSSGLSCETAVTKQDVDVNTPPQAAFSGPEVACTNNEIKFNASATKDDQPANLKYFWQFGDGTSAEGAEVTKAYAKGGLYDVVLTVDDNAGTSCSTDTVSQKVRVNAAPTAVAGEDVTLYLTNPGADYAVAFDGSKSSDPNGDQLSYSWNFGDGAKGDGAKTSHVYSKPGNYSVRLGVNDNSGLPCAVDNDSINVRLNKSPLADAGQSIATWEANDITLDGSGSKGEEGESLSYAWDFGDGSKAEGVTATHSYKQGGQYTATLTVNDGQNTPVSEAIDTVKVSINSRPVASLNSGKISCVGDQVMFDASGSTDADGDSLKYTWDFGDGTTESGSSKVSHRYTKGGKYKVRVTVDDGKGGNCSTSSTSTTVKVNTPPIANAGPNLVCCEEQNSSFDGSASSDADGDKLTYSWAYGDGNTGSGPKVSHAYQDSGQYRVVLTVDDGSQTACSSSSSGFVANVNAKPVPVIQYKQA
ncbi:MAG: hypothetical protein COW12_02225 [Candidatus Omnitrophica bacterium CG12_big_fil_rev_8_21_14_0_65_45_16]|nr:MAG: hypothetical protein COW12_02225 [Candidatus Omnitrophica bacterium CG12_big_fil_rev_8_21_14_0_65_45_16]